MNTTYTFHGPHTTHYNLLKYIQYYNAMYDDNSKRIEGRSYRLQHHNHQISVMLECDQQMKVTSQVYSRLLLLVPLPTNNTCIYYSTMVKLRIYPTHQILDTSTNTNTNTGP